ncbi:hypothetical protein BpHYR1_023901 [Brachionus plicatilis]|uniref:Uncharacterized protein n=1 Tax=Brachionus plicatilis TaxID=10195 RepID=A0A3M7R607_BRAPC|nr:hypothetical protein BpHYR1_023901 [Brachionus plicatilis]
MAAFLGYKMQTAYARLPEDQLHCNRIDMLHESACRFVDEALLSVLQLVQLLAKLLNFFQFLAWCTIENSNSLFCKFRCVHSLD